MMASLIATIATLGLVQAKSQLVKYDFERSCCVASRWSCFVYIHLLVLDTSWSSNSADLYLWYSCQHANTKSTTWIPVYWEATEIQIQIQKTYQCNQIKSLGYQPDYRQQRSLRGGDRNRRHFRSCLGSRQYTCDVVMVWLEIIGPQQFVSGFSTIHLAFPESFVMLVWIGIIGSQQKTFFFLQPIQVIYDITWQDIIWQLSAIHLSYNT